jgi:tight adherence protein B
MTRALLAAAAAGTAVMLVGLAGTSERRRRRLTGILDSASRRPSARRRVPTAANAGGAAAVGALVGWLVAGAAGAIALGGGAAAMPIVRARRRAARRAAAVDTQLLDAVGAVAAAVRSGRSLVQALEAAAEEVGDPLAPTLTLVADRASLGEPLDRALEDWAAAVGGADARLVAGVLRLHRRTGGALARSLDDLARTLRGRREAARELRSLTAQARLSAGILGLLPLGFFLFLSVVARRDIESAYRTSVGASAIVVGLTLQGLAFLWIRRLLRVETE